MSDRKEEQQYLKRKLKVFLKSERHFTRFESIRQSGIEVEEDRFLFHFQILEDNQFITTYSNDNFMGYHIATSGRVVWTDPLLRLTAAGHEFSDALNREEIYEVLKKEFKDASVSTLASVSKQLMSAYAKKTAKKYFDPET